MTRRELVRALLAMAATGAGAACSRAKPASSGDARRIVSLGPSSTEALFAMGAGDRVVARSRYCDWPPEAAKLPAVGGIEPDAEAILELRPDLVVGPSGQWSDRFAATMAAHGVATWFPAEIDSLAGVDAFILGLGARAAHEAAARAVVDRMHATEDAVDRAVSGLPRPRALLVVGTAPLVVAGPKSFADELLRRAGAVNAVVDGGAWPTLGFERAVELDPDEVLDAVDRESEGGTRITAREPGWSGLRAVREGRVVRVADERVLRPGPRIGEGLAVLARAVHPGLALP